MCGGIALLDCAQDTVDLRANHWIARRKVEGPKTIEEIHKEARAELMRQRSSGPPPDRGRRPPPPDARSLPSCALLTTWAPSFHVTACAEGLFKLLYSRCKLGTGATFCGV